MEDLLYRNVTVSENEWDQIVKLIYSDPLAAAVYQLAKNDGSSQTRLLVALVIALAAERDARLEDRINKLLEAEPKQRLPCNKCGRLFLQDGCELCPDCESSDPRFVG